MMTLLYIPPPTPEQILRDMAKLVAAINKAKVTVTIEVSSSETSTSSYDRRLESIIKADRVINTQR